MSANPRRRRQSFNSTRHERPAIVRLLLAMGVVSLLGIVGNSATTHVVQRGETLSQVAARYGTTAGAIARTNGITNIHRIIAGQSLIVGDDPAGLATKPIVATQPIQPTDADSGGNPNSNALGVHVVSPGDTLSRIAKVTGTTVANLAAMNSIANVNQVRIGTRLMIPQAGPPPAPPILDPARIPIQLQAAPERQALAASFDYWSKFYGLPTNLVMGLAWVESGWQNHVISSVGAAGIGQIMPTTATWLSSKVIKEPLDIQNPEHNIRMTAGYLRWLLDRTGGDVAIALASYYQGITSVRTVGVYPASQTYVSAVLGAAARYF